MLTPDQIKGLDIASQRKANNWAGSEQSKATDIKNLDYAYKQGYVYKPPTPQPPVNNLNAETLKAGISSPDITSQLPDNTASNSALQTYNSGTLTDATKTSADIQKQIDAIKAQQLKEAQDREKQAQQAITDYKANTQPAVDAFKANLGNQTTAIQSVYTPEYYTSLLNDKKSITDEIIGYSKLLDGALNDVSIPSLASVATGRKNAVIADFEAKVALKKSALTAIDGNFSLATDILNTGVTKLDDFYTKQLNFNKLAQEIFKTSDVKEFTDRAIKDLEDKQKSLEATKTAIQNLLSDPNTAGIVQKAGILLTDTADEVATKLSTFYSKNPGYNPDNMKANQVLIQKYPDAGINVFDSQDIVKAKLAKSALYQKDTNTGKFTLTYDPITGQPVVFNSNTGDFGSGMRTDRNNNPTAMTTDVAKSLGLVEGVDYVKGDPFPDNPNLLTAKLLGDPIETTIKGLDLAAQASNKKAFYTQSGQPRWTHTAISDEQWLAMTPEQKKNLVASMYQKEGGSGELLNGNTDISQNALNWAKLIKEGKAKLNEVPEKERKAVVQALAEDGTVSKSDAEATAKLQEKIDNIEDIKSTMKKFGANAVGPNKLARFDLWSWASGGKQELIGKVQQLISQDTLNTLINLKKAGGTLGALSDTERLMLQSAATKIGSWAITKNGRVVGYDISEKAFVEELNKIQKIAKTALDNGGGQTGIVNTLEQKLASDPSKVEQYNILVQTFPGLSDDEYNQLLGGE